jgi:hypothetical protein
MWAAKISAIGAACVIESVGLVDVDFLEDDVAKWLPSSAR